MSSVNKRYFDGLMQAKEISLRGLAKRMGMSHSQLSLAFSGLRNLKLEEAAQLAAIFGEPLHRIVENAGVRVAALHNHRVSVIGAMQGDGTVLLNPDGVVERTDAPEIIPATGVAIQARTAGGPLDWMDSWIFFCDRPAGVDSAILGRFSFCQIKNGPAVLASVRRGYKENTFNLRGPYNADSVELSAASPIVTTRN